MGFETETAEILCFGFGCRVENFLHKVLDYLSVNQLQGSVDYSYSDEMCHEKQSFDSPEYQKKELYHFVNFYKWLYSTI